MFVYLFAFLIGLVSGLRAFMGLAAVSWAARLHWLDLQNTPLAFLGYAATPYILSVLAISELVTDQLPKTPSRKVPMQFITRIVTGGICGAAVGAASQMLVGGLLAGMLGAVAGTLGGARMRAILASSFGKDRPAALVEDAIAIGLALFIVLR